MITFSDCKGDTTIEGAGISGEEFRLTSFVFLALVFPTDDTKIQWQ